MKDKRRDCIKFYFDQSLQFEAVVFSNEFITHSKARASFLGEKHENKPE